MGNFAMTKFQEWILRKLFKVLVRQSWDHKKNICKVYSLLRAAADDEFTEDAAPSLDSFMLECFETSQSAWYVGKSSNA